jgi:hypothetical protein
MRRRSTVRVTHAEVDNVFAAPQKDYPQIAIGMMNGGRHESALSSTVKNHTFLSDKGYSLRGRLIFLTNFSPLFL